MTQPSVQIVVNDQSMDSRRVNFYFFFNDFHRPLPLPHERLMSQLKAEYTANFPLPLPLIPRRPPHLSRPPCSRQPVSLVVRSLLCDASEHATSHQSKRPPAKTTSRQNDPGTVKTAPRSIYQWLCLYRCFACGFLETSVLGLFGNSCSQIPYLLTAHIMRMHVIHTHMKFRYTMRLNLQCVGAVLTGHPGTLVVAICRLTHLPCITERRGRWHSGSPHLTYSSLPCTCDR